MKTHLDVNVDEESDVSDDINESEDDEDALVGPMCLQGVHRGLRTNLCWKDAVEGASNDTMPDTDQALEHHAGDYIDVLQMNETIL